MSLCLETGLCSQNGDSDKHTVLCGARILISHIMCTVNRQFHNVLWHGRSLLWCLLCYLL